MTALALRGGGPRKYNPFSELTARESVYGEAWQQGTDPSRSSPRFVLRPKRHWQSPASLWYGPGYCRFSVLRITRGLPFGARSDPAAARHVTVSRVKAAQPPSKL